jgi:hypothetical protein
MCGVIVGQTTEFKNTVWLFSQQINSAVANVEKMGAAPFQYDGTEGT